MEGRAIPLHKGVSMIFILFDNEKLVGAFSPNGLDLYIQNILSDIVWDIEWIRQSDNMSWVNYGYETIGSKSYIRYTLVKTVIDIQVI